MHILVSGLSRFTAPTGICRHVAGLVKALNTQSEIERITCAVGPWQQDYYERLLGLTSGTKIEVTPIDIPNKPLSRNLWFSTKLPELARRLGANVVHLSFPIPISRKKFSCRTVVTLHDLYPYDFPSNIGYPKVLFIRAFLKNCINNSDAVACVSEATANRLREVLPSTTPKRIAVIPNVLDFSDVSGIRPEWISGSQPFLLTVAQHRKNKNLPLAVSGFREMQDREILPSNTMLVIVGSEGPETPVVRRTIEDLGLQDSIKLLSSIDDSQLRWLYEHCTLFLATSTVEGFCVPLLEAMYFGCRIVCSDIPIFREIGSDDCHYFDLRNAPVESLTRAGIGALQETSPSHTFPHSKYSTRFVGEQYVSLYSELLGSKTSTALQY